MTLFLLCYLLVYFFVSLFVAVVYIYVTEQDEGKIPQCQRSLVKSDRTLRGKYTPANLFLLCYLFVYPFVCLLLLLFWFVCPSERKAESHDVIVLWLARDRTLRGRDTPANLFLLYYLFVYCLWLLFRFTWQSERKAKFRNVAVCWWTHDHTLGGQDFPVTLFRLW